MFIRDIEKLKAAGVRTFTSIVGIDAIGKDEMQEIKGEDLLNMDW
jgi:hypothetical protein